MSTTWICSSAAAKESGAGVGRRFGGGAPAGRALGEHPDGGAITVRAGRYGPYVNWGAVNATLPKGITEAAVMLDQAMDLIRAKIASGPPPKAGRKPAKAKAPAKGAATAKAAAGKKPPAKTAANKAPAKKAPAKKAPSSKPSAG